MSALSTVWKTYPSFRQAFRALASLSSERLEALEELVEEGFEVPASEVAAAVGVSDFAEAHLMLSAAERIYTSARQAGQTGEEVTDEILELVEQYPEDFQGVDVASKRDQLASIFDSRSKVERKDIQRFTESRTFTALENAVFSIELRVVRNQADSDDNRDRTSVVPVIGVRLVFDEHIATGSQAMAFQMSLETASLLGARLAGILEEVEEVQEELGERIFRP